MQNLASTFVKSKYFGFRGFIVLIGIITSLSIYYYIVDFYNPDGNILKFFVTGTEEYTFFSGEDGGFYIRIGQTLDSKTKNGGYDIKIKNERTAGGSENSIKVLSTPNSFGLVQEETLKEGDFIRNHINYIAPLYLERLHILYRKDKYLNEYKGKGTPNISSNCSKQVLKMFQNAKINTGKNGSGCKIISSYIISEINNQLSTKKPTPSNDNQSIGVSHDIDNPYESLISDDPNSIDIYFALAGAPLIEVQNILDNDKVGMMSIDPSLISQINRKYGLNLRMCDFNEIYTNTNAVSSLGSYAFLISSKDVSTSAVHDLVNILHQSKDEINSHNSSIDAHNPLEEFDFGGSFNSSYEDNSYSILRNVLVFAVTVTSSSALVIAFLLWLISTIKMNSYFNSITDIYSGDAIFKVEVDTHSDNIALPNLQKNQSHIIEIILKKLSLLSDEKTKLYDDHRTGGITESHHAYLMKNFNDIKHELKVKLAERLYEQIHSSNSFNQDKLRLFYTSGFLNKEDYDFLSSKIDNPVQS